MFFFSNKLKGKGTRCSFSEPVSIDPFEPKWLFNRDQKLAVAALKYAEQYYHFFLRLLETIQTRSFNRTGPLIETLEYKPYSIVLLGWKK